MCQELRLAFYDFQCDIRSDSREFVAAVEQFHRRFVIPATAQSHKPPLFIYSTRTGRQVLKFEDHEFPIDESALSSVYIYVQLLQYALARVHSHVLVHAGVVSLNGNGVVLVADSMQGKTTLVLELVRRGFGFLSDEIAAFSRTDRKVHPYPRAVSIRPPTFDLLGIAPPLEQPNWFGKFIFDIDDLFPGHLGGPVPVKHLILLTSPAPNMDNGHVAPPGNPALLLNRFDDGLLAALETVAGISVIEIDEHAPTPTVRLAGDVNAQTYTTIAELCRRHDVLMLNFDTPPQQADFSAAARLESIPTSQGILGLMRGLHAGYDSELVQEAGPARIFSDLATVLQNAQCHRLHVGPLQQNADLVCGLLSE